MTRVLFVCMGNICRSPLAEAALRTQAAAARIEVEVDSAGTHDYHVGEGADPRAAEAGRLRGYDVAGHRARQVAVEDFGRFDYLLAMDAANLSRLRRLAPAGHRATVSLLLDYGSTGVREVPDPYFGGATGFEHALDLIDSAVAGLLEELRRR